MSLNKYLLFLIIILGIFAPKIVAANSGNANLYIHHNQSISPIEPVNPKIANQPRLNRILYRMGYTIFGLGSILIFSNLAIFAIIASFSTTFGLSFFLSMGWVYLLIIPMTIFLILYTIRLIDDSVLIQSKSRQANWQRAKKRFYLSLPLIAVLGIMAFLCWFYYVGTVLILANAGIGILILVFTIWDIRQHWYPQKLEVEKTYE